MQKSLTKCWKARFNNTHAKETKTEPNKTNSERTTRQPEPPNEIKQFESELRKTQNLKTKP